MNAELTKFLTNNFVFSNEVSAPKSWGNTTPYPLYLTALNYRFAQPNLLIGDILFCAREFYALEAIEILAQNKPTEREPYGLIPFKKSHEKWEADFRWYKSRFISGFASAIYDYIIKTVAGELRHCYKRCNYCINGYMQDEVDIDCRDDVFENIRFFNPHEILKYGEFLFDPVWTTWDSGYGGPKWQNIAKAGKLYKKMPDAVFIDHCVDLSHNNSSFFDKGGSIFLLKGSSSYLDFLGMKRYASPKEVLENSKVVSVVTESLLRRGITLGILPSELNHLTICNFHRLFDRIAMISDSEFSATDKYLNASNRNPQLFIPYGFNVNNGFVRNIIQNFFQSNAIAWNTLIYKPVIYQNKPIGKIRIGSGPCFKNFPSEYLSYGKNYYNDEREENREDEEGDIPFASHSLSDIFFTSGPYMDNEVTNLFYEANRVFTRRGAIRLNRTEMDLDQNHFIEENIRTRPNSIYSF